MAFPGRAWEREGCGLFKDGLELGGGDGAVVVRVQLGDDAVGPQAARDEVANAGVLEQLVQLGLIDPAVLPALVVVRERLLVIARELVREQAADLLLQLLLLRRGSHASSLVLLAVRRAGARA